MRTSSWVIAAALLALAGAADAQQPAGLAPTPYASAQAALERGLDAFQAGRHEAALSALSAAAAMDDPSARFFAEFYLARIYSETAGPATNHTKAFVLFRKLADDNLDADPSTSSRAPFVAKALIALAHYVRSGLKEIDLKPNPRLATDYLHHAAVFFGDKDAQFELAKIYLAGDARSDDVRRGLHHLSVLTEEGYAPAQAVLADLFWRGRHVKKDERRALALISLAVENAPTDERLWIEESYAGIFCAATPAVRADADDLLGKFRKVFAQPAAGPGSALAAGSLEFLPERQCATGEKVALGAPTRPSLATAASSGQALTLRAPKIVLPPASLPLPQVGFKAAGMGGGIMEAAAKK
jgi:hypothetical protein